ncbi:MAG: DUF4190 domain-containing protein [Verrucomicrobia bacterium]|nr:DUF4190 domain-containing protein [Verrucomicrobiota bacterium]
MNEPPPMPTAENSQVEVASKTSKAAVWSLLLGVSSFCTWVVGSIPALILGGIALNNINKSQGRLGGKGLAITGIVTGGGGLIVGIFTLGIVAGIAMPAFVGVQESAKISVEQKEIRMLVTACHAYAAKNGGKFPEVLQDLYPEYINDESVLNTMNEESRQPEAYMYFSGKTIKSEARSLLIASPVVRRQYIRVVGFCDTSVENIEDEEFYRLAELESNEQ